MLIVGCLLSPAGIPDGEEMPAMRANAAVSFIRELVTRPQHTELITQSFSWCSSRWAGRHFKRYIPPRSFRIKIEQKACHSRDGGLRLLVSSILSDYPLLLVLSTTSVGFGSMMFLTKRADSDSLPDLLRLGSGRSGYHLCMGRRDETTQLRRYGLRL